MLAAFGLAVAAAVVLGFSRFAYALLPPPMRDALGLTYAEAGSLNTANGVGYVAGAVASAAAARRWGPARPFRLGVLASALLLLATPLISSLAPLLLIRTLGGFSTAFAFILVARRGTLRRSDDLLFLPAPRAPEPLGGLRPLRDIRRRSRRRLLHVRIRAVRAADPT